MILPISMITDIIYPKQFYKFKKIDYKCESPKGTIQEYRLQIERLLNFQEEEIKWVYQIENNEE